ncbi:DUF418 domain-containing protein [Fulvivirga sedimenti]|uniref:DUF418 domain-containing protein n=1 Tax=Fulvivirga sedimenti TaxID=2879465 RepID=A0A9X1HRY3_9BACT|nr:DUF418 domain-containing protein [Fulvivirga sedimenti]MCA6075112.1 DUF418 domain-containing protein [Fulvivirga sedimenti]MCA6076289.1 DUF418 domain-containing protein [Fulvivirga sedimenti]MCA6077417.1 DUF418 domain-containing protein [Fulvivirga sedimenti]
MQGNLNDPQPIQATKRLGSLDFLRGIAVLGILVINIESFAYDDPWSPFKYGFDSAVDANTRFWVYFLAQGKFFSMFTLLFGVGFFMFLERLQGLGLKAMDIYARRLLWLFIFGVIHAYVIWDGDVLYHYAICGFLLFPFRSFKLKQLMITVLIFTGILFYNSYQNAKRIEFLHEQAILAQRLPAEDRTGQQAEDIEIWKKRTSKGIAVTDTATVRKSLVESITINADHSGVHKGNILYPGILFRTLIMMILGIILYKTGIFSDIRNKKLYWSTTLLLFFVALVINYLRYDHWTFHYFEPVENVWQSWLFTLPKETLGVAYILVLNGLYHQVLKGKDLNPISLAGRMALTNYIMQSIICALIFYGYGFGRYNTFNRYELLFIVSGIWIFQLIASTWWMKTHKQGPLEALWRKLTYR